MDGSVRESRKSWARVVFYVKNKNLYDTGFGTEGQVRCFILFGTEGQVPCCIF